MGDWHRLCSTGECTKSASQIRSAQRIPMANSYRLETLRGTAAVNRLQVVTLIASLSHSVDLLTAGIEHEEAQAGVRDPANPAYPILAKSLRARHHYFTGGLDPRDAQSGLRPNPGEPKCSAPSEFTSPLRLPRDLEPTHHASWCR
jgi:hypothetical protein